MNINGHSILVPQIVSNHKDVESINKKIIKQLKIFIDSKSSLNDLKYTIEYDGGRYASIIIEYTQYEEKLPHPVKQAHAINIDLEKDKILNNYDIVKEVDAFCDDINGGKYSLATDISNNISDSMKYIGNIWRPPKGTLFEVFMGIVWRGLRLEAEEPDGVDPATGHLILSRTDLSLEGTGGMVFELNCYYNSYEAGIGHPTVEYLGK